MVVIEHPVVVIALAVLQLFVVRVNVLPDGGWPDKVERRARDISEFTCRNHRGIYRREPLGAEPKLMRQNVALPGASEVEI